MNAAVSKNCFQSSSLDVEGQLEMVLIASGFCFNGTESIMLQKRKSESGCGAKAVCVFVCESCLKVV